MLLAAKDALAALVNKVRANRVLGFELLFGPRFHFREQDHGAEVFGLASVRGVDGVSNVAPHVRRVVTVQVDDGFGQVGLRIGGAHSGATQMERVTFLIGLGSDLIEVVLIGLVANDVDDLVEGRLGMILGVLVEVVAKNSVVTNFEKSHIRQHLPINDVGLALLRRGECLRVASFGANLGQLRACLGQQLGEGAFTALEIPLGGLSNSFGQCGFAHAGETHRHEEEFFDTVHLAF